MQRNLSTRRDSSNRTSVQSPILWPYLSTDPAEGRARLMDCFVWISAQTGVPIRRLLINYKRSPERRAEIRKMMREYHRRFYRGAYVDALRSSRAARRRRHLIAMYATVTIAASLWVLLGLH